MKKRLALGIVCLLLAGVLVIGCGSETDPAKIIPEDAQAVVIIPCLGATGEHLGEFLDYIAKQAPEEFATELAGMVRMVGADLTKPEELAAKGINPKAGAGFAFINPLAMEAAILIPVKKEEAFISFLNELAKKRGVPELKKEGDVYKAGSMPGVIKIKKGFAIFAQNPATLDKLPGKGNSLSDNEDYKVVVEELGSDGDLILYVSGKLLAAAPNPQAQQMAKMLAGLKSLGGALNISKNELSIKLFFNMSEMGDMSKILSADGKDSLLESLPGPAPILARANLSFPELWNYLKTKSSPEVKKNLDMVMAQMKVPATVNFESDIINNIVGNLAMAYYGQSGKGRRKTPDFVLTLTLKDDTKVRESLEKIADSLKSQRRKKKKTNLEEMGVIELGRGREKIYLAVVKKNLVMTQLADRMKSMFAAFAGSGAESAISSVENEEAKKALRNKKATVAYVSAASFAEAVKQGMSRKEKAQLEAYQAQMPGLLKSYMIMSGEIKEKGGLLTVTVHLGE